MKRKEQDRIIELAFGELTPQQELELERALAANSDLSSEFKEMEALKNDLAAYRRHLDVSLPDCQVSKERLRDAILSQGVRQTVCRRNWWTTALPVAAGVALFAVFLNTPQGDAIKNLTPPPKTVSEPEARPTDAQPSMVSPEKTPEPVAVRVSTKPASKQGRLASALRGTGSKVVRDTNTAAAAKTGGAQPEVATPVVSAPIEEPEDVVVIVDSSVTASNGALNAMELSESENVLIGG